ncbi:MAG: hypothetical protein O3B01_30600 [Planctomycetota bacterium]|nr:hypothetical protein [Planctomycetota bacterium]MDA1142933.1 hypothetical protein [Planctomycetota bacterium]
MRKDFWLRRIHWIVGIAMLIAAGDPGGANGLVIAMAAFFISCTLVRVGNHLAESVVSLSSESER